MNVGIFIFFTLFVSNEQPNANALTNNTTHVRDCQISTRQTSHFVLHLKENIICWFKLQNKILIWPRIEEVLACSTFVARHNNDRQLKITNTNGIQWHLSNLNHITWKYNNIHSKKTVDDDDDVVVLLLLLIGVADAWFQRASSSTIANWI